MTIATNDAKRIFMAALDLANLAERATYVENACAGDADLRQRVEALLRAHDEPGAFLSEATLDPNATAMQSGPSRLVGLMIAGRYKLIEQIGDGGMGTVWMAEQREPVKRLVAVKLIKPGMDSSAVLARFEAERQALALMDHPNIAKVLDGGTMDDGRPYFVMELVKGLPLTEYCDTRRLSVNDRLNLFIQICAAVQHAHQKAVIHRDLKPSNVLVTEHDGRPVPKVIDFGLAKALNASNMLTERTLHTAYGTVVGTPLYMAPEQVGINAMDVDTRTDIYSLGVILYELLAGSTPLEKARFKEAAWEEVKRLIRDEEPPKPSTRLSGSIGLPSLAACRQSEPAQLSRLVRGELDWIVMKALEKDRSRRYETANGFAMDVQRFLAGEPVQAVPPSVSYKFRKFVRKNRAPVAVACLVGISLLGGIAGTTWGLIRAVQGRREALQAREEAAERAESERIASQQASLSEERAQQTAYAARMALAGSDWQNGNVGRIRATLAETESYPDRGFEWYYWQRMCRLESLTYQGHTNRVHAVAFSPDGRRIASGAGYGHIGDAIRVFDADTGRELLEMRGHKAHVSTIAYSPDGKRIASGSHDNKVKIWDANTGQLLVECNPGDWVYSVVFSPDGKRIASRAHKGSASVQIWDVETGRELRKFDSDWNTESVAFSPDGRHIVTGTRHGGLVVWDVETERPVGTSFASFPDAVGKESDKDQRYYVYAVAYTADGQRIFGKMGRRLIVWDAKSGAILQNAHQVSAEFDGFAISPDSKSIAGATNRIVKVWDLKTGNEQFSFKGHEQDVSCIAFSPDPASSRIVSGSGDGTAKVWELDPAPGRR